MSPRNKEGGPKLTLAPSSSVSSIGKAALLTACVGFNSQIARAGDLDGISIGTATEIAGVNTVGRDQYSSVVIDGKTLYIDAEGVDAQIRMVDGTMSEGESIEVCGEGTFHWLNTPRSIDIGEDGRLFVSVEDLFEGDFFRLMNDTSVDGDWSSCDYELKDFSAYDPESFSLSYDYLTGKVDSAYWNGIDNDLLLASGATYDSGGNDGAPGRCHGTDFVFYQAGSDIFVTNSDATEHLRAVLDAKSPRCQQDESTGEWVLSFSQLNAYGDLDLYRATLTLPGSTSDPEEPVDPDADGDGYPASVDCDDNDPNTYPGAPEYCNGVDNDCDGIADNNNPVDGDVYYVDADGDGYGANSVEGLPRYCDGDAPDGMSTLSGDCNDGDASINPGAEEVCDGRDNDCDGTVDEGGVCDEGEEVYSASLEPGESIEIAGSSLSSAEDSEGDAHLSYDPETGTMTITLDSGAYVEGLLVTAGLVKAGLVGVPNTAEFVYEYNDGRAGNWVSMCLCTSSTAMGFSTRRADARVYNTCEVDEEGNLAQLRLTDRSLSEEGVADSMLSINPDLDGWMVQGGIDLITQDVPAGQWTEAMDSQECVEVSTQEPINKAEDPKGGCSTASTPVSMLALAVPFLAGFLRRRRTA